MASVRRGNIRLAIRTLKSAKARSFLTMLGIVIGVSAVICVICIGEGVKQQVTGKVNRFGKDLITIRPGTATGSSVGIFGSGAFSNGSGFLTNDDLKTVSQTQDVGMTVPLSTLPGMLQGDFRLNNPLVVATGDDFPQALNQKLAFGSFFSTTDTVPGIVLGSKLSDQLFSESVPIGRSVEFRGHKFVVEGIFDQFDASPFSLTADFNSAAFIPYDQALQIAGQSLGMYQILARPNSSALTKTVTSRIQANLNRAHGGAHDTAVLTNSSNLVSSEQIVHLLTLLIIGGAIIALIVGGVGIMDVMLVSVTERMQEIGVRKAIGATERQILSQFITEAFILSGVGAIIGCLVALLIIGALRLYSSLQPVLVWQSFVISVVLAIGVGVLFGAAPALKAARKDPIDALRHE